MTSVATRRDTEDDRARTGATRVAILQSLRESESPMTVQQLANHLTLHPNSVRFHLVRLVSADLVGEDQAAPSGRGRPRLLYSAVTTPSPRHGTGSELLAEALARHLAHAVPDPRHVAEEAGKERGRRLVLRDGRYGPVSEEEAKAEITSVMRSNGFDPQWDPDRRRLWLRTCPFRPLADQQPAVVCSVHLGLLRGVLDSLDAPVEAVSLDAFPAPHPCLAVFAPRTGEDAPPDEARATRIADPAVRRTPTTVRPRPAPDR